MYQVRNFFRVIIPSLGVRLGIGLMMMGWALWANAQTTLTQEIMRPFPQGTDLEEPLEERLIEGMNRGMKQDYRGAIAIFSELIQRYPTYADAYFNRGIARAKLQDYQGAIADQTKAIDLNPQLAEAYQRRAEIYWQLGNYSQAKDDLRTAIHLFALHQNVISQKQAEELLQQWQ